MCRGTWQPWLTTSDRNRRTDDIRFTYLRCTICRLVRLEHVPADLGRYYADAYYEIPSLARLRQISAAESYQLGILLPHARRGRLLEIGPAWGQFALQAKLAGFDVSGIEMDARCCEYLRNVVGVTAYQSAAPHEVIGTLEPQDAAVMWQVVEHLPDPWRTLTAIARNLVPGGSLVIATPNLGALSLAMMGAAWPHIDAPRHVWLIPLASLVRHATTVGLEFVKAHFADKGAIRWSLFAWQRLLMNAASGRTATTAAYLAGTCIGALMAPLEVGMRRPASYTAIFRKPR